MRSTICEKILPTRKQSFICLPMGLLASNLHPGGILEEALWEQRFSDDTVRFAVSSPFRILFRLPTPSRFGLPPLRLFQSVSFSSYLPLIRSLSQSKSFYYLTAASLSALFGILLVIFFLIKRYGSNNAAMGVAAVTYSIGLTSFFRHWFLQVFWTFFLNHYQLVLVYMAVFAFIGVLLVRLKVFSEPKSQPTSLFDTVRWALKVVSVTLILNSTASVMLSLLSYPVFFVLMKRINVVTSRLFA